MFAPLIALLNTLIPIIAVVGAYLIAIHQEVAVACIPLWEGCTSISRAARYGDALFWFRGFMMPLSMLMVIYWIYQWHWLNELAGKRIRHHVILALSIISALALVLYANYLGSEGDFYRFMRRTGVIFYFSFAALAQLMTLQSLHSADRVFGPYVQRLLRVQFALVSAQWVIGLSSLWVNLAEPSWSFEGENVVEWNFGWAMVSFYAVSFWLWRALPPKALR
ncbi:hypothetical protein [Marinimicrobium alkaliphilum]|uniref:hypothetical protein n=1 Tax=Marinimicrobium alkaliphilum TaxID=2202654 RepID=UPI000DBA4471|nr:hypothetical protein [Marinimicrobium alkaliphilum]